MAEFANAPVDLRTIPTAVSVKTAKQNLPEQVSEVLPRDWAAEFEVVEAYFASIDLRQWTDRCDNALELLLGAWNGSRILTFVGRDTSLPWASEANWTKV